MFKLLFSKRLGPLFCTQFLGAFNDNLFKNTVALVFIFSSLSESEASNWSSIVAGLFILPFWIFSPLAGQISDKTDKAKMLFYVKASETPIMLLGGIGLYYGSNTLLLLTAFLMGSQSAFFGPAKYSILPQTLARNDVVAGNALLNMSTFIAIILGTLASGIAKDLGDDVLPYVGLSAVLIALLGLFSAWFIAPAPALAASKNSPLDLNFFRSMRHMWGLSKKVSSVHLSLLGMAWFWLLCAVLLAQVPTFARFVLHGDATLGSLFMVLFVVGISFGSFLCVKLSKTEIELGLIPFGAFGIALVGFHFCSINWLPLPPTQGNLSAASFFSFPMSSRNLFTALDLALIAMFAAFFHIPLFALIQTRSPAESRSQIIAANNILSAAFMVFGTVLTSFLSAALGFSTIEIFFTLFCLHLVVAVYIFTVIPEFYMRFVLWLLASTIYRIRYSNRDAVPLSGPAVIVANHVSFIDWFIITAACRRPCRFVMDQGIFRTPILGSLFRLAKAIPIASAKVDPDSKVKAFKEIASALELGHLVCIFPEGMITYDGKLNTFRPGVEQILKTSPVPVIPIALDGLWGSFFSRRGGKAFLKIPTPSWRQINVKLGSPLSPDTSAVEIQNLIADMLRQPATT